MCIDRAHIARYGSLQTSLRRDIENEENTRLDCNSRRIVKKSKISGSKPTRKEGRDSTTRNLCEGRTIEPIVGLSDII